MKTFKIATGLFVMICCLAAPFSVGPALSDSVPITVTAATDATWPPMEMVDQNKNIVGFAIDYFTAAAREAGFNIEFKNTAWDGIFAGVATGKYDAVISSVTITDERKKTMDFSEPYLNAGQIIVVPKTTTQVETLADLKGNNVGAQIGTTGAFEIKKVDGVTLKSYDEVGLAFEDMAAGRISGVVCDTPVAANYALQKDEYRDKFKIVGKPFTDEYYGVAIKKGNQKIVDLFNKGIREIKAKGIDKQIEEKWLR
ncbi:MAG: basic amino acid ABC transporter substrate-binding protein [Desulfobacterales bacterium]|nr:basic amino acid ABC transporter substrate-binding protein [Desulfobacterales bacterium]MDD4071085.1 basic amino acid ABC transporter substrate-binding protein [Desulfobacterales bacterium]MDD4392146.1 basic amino acid ABC transporter substrate-binding protein [Desulfobacterales bacterium]